MTPDPGTPSDVGPQALDLTKLRWRSSVTLERPRRTRGTRGTKMDQTKEDLLHGRLQMSRLGEVVPCWTTETGEDRRWTRRTRTEDTDQTVEETDQDCGGGPGPRRRRRRRRWTRPWRRRTRTVAVDQDRSDGSSLLF